MKKKVSVLVVDGEPDIRALLKEFLVPLGFEVFETGLPRQALLFITEYDFSLVLFEYDLPGTTGPRFHEEACNVRPALRNRFIFMTCGLTDASTLMGCRYLAKPFDFSQLDAAIRAVLQQAGDSPKASAISHRAFL